MVEETLVGAGGGLAEGGVALGEAGGQGAGLVGGRWTRQRRGWRRGWAVRRCPVAARKAHVRSK